MKILLDTHIFLWFILFKEIAVLYRQAVRLLRQVNADEQRVILTFDRDGGELLYRWRRRSPRGVIYLRFRPHTPEEPASILLNLLQTEGLQFEERFRVVEDDRIRQRPLP